MIPLLFAVALTLTGPVQKPAEAPKISPFVVKDLKDLPLGAILTPGLQQELAKARCQNRTTQALGPDGAPVQKLGDLPPGLLEHAVNRMVNGCPVREIVYAGQTYYLDAPVGGLQRLDPAVRTTKPR